MNKIQESIDTIDRIINFAKSKLVFPLLEDGVSVRIHRDLLTIKSFSQDDRLLFSGLADNLVEQQEAYPQEQETKDLIGLFVEKLVDYKDNLLGRQKIENDKLIFSDDFDPNIDVHVIRGND